MKRILLIVALLISTLTMNAQPGNAGKTDSLTHFYIGLGTGLNSYTGLLGLSANVRIHKTVFAQVGLGLGTWGSKFTAGLRYDMSYGSGMSYGIGISTCSGASDIKGTLQLKSGVSKTVTVDYLRAYTLNLKASYNWLIGNSNTFYLDFGYAMPLQSSPWRVTDGSDIAPVSKSVLNFVAPGGILFGLGFTFGL